MKGVNMQCTRRNFLKNAAAAGGTVALAGMASTAIAEEAAPTEGGAPAEGGEGGGMPPMMGGAVEEYDAD